MIFIYKIKKNIEVSLILNSSNNQNINIIYHIIYQVKLLFTIKIY